jgi:succinyl-diaminopimelate desuccinylase
MEAIKKKVQHYIEEHKHELLKLCCSLVKAKSENPPGDVSESTHILQSFLKHNGLQFKQLEPRPRHINTIVSIGGKGKNLILCGHIDTVPAGDSSNWSFPPYCGLIKNGEILGRGSTDMKGGIAATLMALVVLQRFEKDFHGKVTAAFVCDEEIGGNFGAKWLIEHKKLSGDACLITEPSAYLAYGYTIDAGERGAYWLKFTALGKPAHGSWPMMGRNAIITMTNFLSKLREIEEMEVKTQRDAAGLVIGGKKVLAKIARQNRIPTKTMTRILDHYTVNIGVIAGGTKTNVVPEKCEAEVDFRIPIGGSKKDVNTYIQKMMPKGFGYKILQESPPSYSKLDDKLTQIIKLNVKKFFKVTPPAIAVWATSDAWHFRNLLGIHTLTFGPGFIEKAHSYNETISAVDVINSAKVYANVIIDYLISK